MPITQIITVQQLKESLNIDQETTKHDSKLAEIVHDTTQEINLVLQPYGDIPIETGTEQYIHAQKCAITYARMLWFESQFQPEKVKTTMEIYTGKLDDLRKSLIAQKTDKRISVFISDDNALDQLYHPNAIDNYITRLF